MASEYNDPGSGVRATTWPDVQADPPRTQGLEGIPKAPSAGKAEQSSLPAWQRLARWFFSPSAYPVKLFVASRVFFLSITYSVLALLSAGHEAHRG